VPLEFFQKGDDQDPYSRRIRGFVTTEHPDRDGEIVLQDGLDFSDFLKYGHFNDNRGQKTRDMLGWPISVERKRTADGRVGHYVEGYLIRGWEPAEEVWRLGQALQTAKAPRRLGFSVEGKIDQRGEQNGLPTVVRARVRNVAITSQPVNPYTGLDLVTKALMAGNAIGAPAPVPGEGFPLRQESLEGSPAIAAPAPAPVSAGTRQTKRKRRMSPDEALGFLVRKGHSPEAAMRILSLAQGGL
jgi:hypothetical protein